MIRVIAICLFGAAALCQAAAAQQSEKKVEPKVISYAALEKVIESHRGEVVVVYFWAVYNPPSMVELPKFLKLQDELAKSGLKTVLVSLDPEDDDYHKSVAKFLTVRKVTLPTYILDEKGQEILPKKLDFRAVPNVAIYGRDGKLASVVRPSADGKLRLLEQTDKLVRKLLAKKKP